MKEKEIKKEDDGKRGGGKEKNEKKGRTEKERKEVRNGRKQKQMKGSVKTWEKGKRERGRGERMEELQQWGGSEGELWRAGAFESC